MLEEGANVVVADCNSDRLGEFARKPTVSGRTICATKIDAQRQEEVEKAVQIALERHGAIDILVNAIGGSTMINNPTAAIGDLLFSEWQKLIGFNLDPMFFSCTAVVPHMKHKKSGKIVNVSSLAGRGISTETSAAYAAAKGGVNSFTRKLSLELAPHGINVNAIAPSLTLTERIQDNWNVRPNLEKESILKAIPLRRVPYAKDQAAVICFLASADADFISGAVIDVAGGQ